MGIADADTAENGDPKAIHVITPVMCAVAHRGVDDPKLVGQNKIRVLPGTRLAECMGAGDHDEGFFCNYEVNADFVPRFAGGGLRANALGPQGELRGVEMPEHPFFVGTLFQPQLTSNHTGKAHALIVAYLRAIASQSHRTSQA
jgi:CTP synthase (UTP-ammonia lyase)